ncbi:hypothetical protein SDC9_177924 [bioreactor metagenome]|uniref:Uncharacterized protein n=1 Tax=bioreactor metagenome TaxID=1076179 RepID=A0A645H3Q3_9ZZZZ
MHTVIPDNVLGANGIILQAFIGPQGSARGDGTVFAHAAPRSQGRMRKYLRPAFHMGTFTEDGATNLRIFSHTRIRHEHGALDAAARAYANPAANHRSICQQSAGGHFRLPANIARGHNGGIGGYFCPMLNPNSFSFHRQGFKGTFALQHVPLGIEILL